MSLIPHSFFPRSAFDTNQWMKPIVNPLATSALANPFNTLDFFDPFDELDHMVGRNLEWLNKPDFMPQMPLLPRVPQK